MDVEGEMMAGWCEREIMMRRCGIKGLLMESVTQSNDIYTLVDR